jgi:hypothetical protein
MWKPILIKEVIGFYEASSDGIIKSLPRIRKSRYNSTYHIDGRILKQTMAYNGYAVVTLSNNGFNKSFYVHRLIADLFIENPSGLEFINHIDGRKTNNKASNLEWCTRSENMLHAFKTGLIRKRTKKGV